MEHLSENEPALGFDLLSEEKRRLALERARDTGVAAATPPIRLVQEPGAQLGFLVLLPIYDGPATSLEERRTKLQGFAVAVYGIGDLVDASLRPALTRGLGVTVTDARVGAGDLSPGDRDAGRHAVGHDHRRRRAGMGAALRALARVRWLGLPVAGVGVVGCRHDDHGPSPFSPRISGVCATGPSRSRRRTRRCRSKYVDYWMELNDKGTVVFDPATSSRGSYLTLGATPTVGLGVAGATLDVGTYANFVSSDFYQRFDGADGGSGLAIMSVAPKVNLPLKFLGVTYGAWTGYVGVSYYHLRNEGLLDGNQLLDGSVDRKSNLARFHGLTVFF
jgi:hypothetical protein